MLEWLGQVSRANDLYLFLRSAPEFDCVRSTPAYRDLVHRIGLDQ